MKFKDLLRELRSPSEAGAVKAEKRLDMVLDMIEVMPVLTELAEKADYYSDVYSSIKLANVTDKAIVESAVYILAGFVYASAYYTEQQSAAEKEHSLQVSCSALKAIKELQIAASIAEPDGSLLERRQKEEETVETVETVETTAEGGN